MKGQEIQRVLDSWWCDRRNCPEKSVRNYNSTLRNTQKITDLRTVRFRYL